MKKIYLAIILLSSMIFVMAQGNNSENPRGKGDELIDVLENLEDTTQNEADEEYIYSEQSGKDYLKEGTDSLETEELLKDQKSNNFIEVHDDWDKEEVIIGRRGQVKVREEDDTVKIKIGKKGIKIVEDGGDSSVEMFTIDEDTEDEFFTRKHEKTKWFWDGIDIGINNFVDDGFSMARSDNDEFMDLNTGKSWNININFLEQGFCLGTDRVAFVTGMGFEFNNYFFDNNNNITKDSLTGNIVSEDYSFDLDKSKLSTTYLIVPLLFEVQLLPVENSKRIHISAGVIGGVKIGSKTKIVYQEDGDKKKDKDKGDFNLSSLKYGFTARVGYRELGLYCNYYPTPLFEKGKGPELYPFAMGISLCF